MICNQSDGRIIGLFSSSGRLCAVAWQLCVHRAGYDGRLATGSKKQHEWLTFALVSSAL